jgi:peroxiredoxin
VVRLEKEYRFDTDDGEKTLGELFDGRSQLLVYHFMFGPHYTAGCPICSSTADSFNGVLPHLEACGVTTICVSRAPLENLLAFRQRMGWSFNWASSYKSDFNLDFGVSATEKTTRDVPRLLQGNEVTALPLLDEQRLRDNPPLVAAQYASATSPKGMASVPSRARATPFTTATPATPVARSSSWATTRSSAGRRKAVTRETRASCGFAVTTSTTARDARSGAIGTTGFRATRDLLRATRLRNASCSSRPTRHLPIPSTSAP